MEEKWGRHEEQGERVWGWVISLECKEVRSRCCSNKRASLKRGGMAGGSVALAIVCVAALQGAAGEPHANDGHSFL